jgi:hypothetical protein
MISRQASPCVGGELAKAARISAELPGLEGQIGEVLYRITKKPA